VYERLEQQVETLKVHGEQGADEGKRSAQEAATLEHTAPYGSDSPEQARPTSARAPARTQAAFGEGESRRKPDPHDPQKSPRRRRLVRLASELRTHITAIERGLRGKRMPWLGAGGAVGLAFALALITVVVRHKPHARPPALPVPATPVFAAAPPAPLVIADAQALRTAEAGVDQVVGVSAADGPVRDAGPSRAAKPKRAARLGSVDGTPLFTEPGF
jgi:hypothetical protein